MADNIEQGITITLTVDEWRDIRDLLVNGEGAFTRKHAKYWYELALSRKISDTTGQKDDLV